MATIKVFALGGLDERGKNLYCIDVDNDIFVFDAGTKNPERGILGIDTVIANFDFLKENKARIKGIFITKPSDDCSEAVTYMLKELDLKVYGSSMVSAILKFQLNRFKVRNRDGNFVIINEEDVLEFGQCRIEVFKTTTNIPNSYGYALHTPDGTIIYTGDYIFDAQSSPYFATDMRHLSRIAQNNVLLLLSEASSASRMDYTAPNHKIYSSISRAIKEAPGRVVLACFDQDLHKVSEFLRLASEKGIKEVGIYGPTLLESLRQQDHKFGIGEMEFKLISEIQDQTNCAIIIAGNGERLYSRLIKIAVGNDDNMSIKENDTIILATPPNPGSELNHANVLDELSRTESIVVALNDRKVWTMTASYEDIKLMCSITHPRYFIPVKGLYKDFVRATHAATEACVESKNAIIVDNGDVVLFENGVLKSTKDRIRVGDTYVDGIGVGDIGAVVLNERKQLATDGVVIIGVTIDKHTKQITSLIDTQLRGVIYIQDTNDIFKDMQKLVTEIVEKHANKAKNNDFYDVNEVRNEIKTIFSQFIRQQTGKNPIILAIINEI